METLTIKVKNSKSIDSEPKNIYKFRETEVLQDFYLKTKNVTGIINVYIGSPDNKTRFFITQLKVDPHSLYYFARGKSQITLEPNNRLYISSNETICPHNLKFYLGIKDLNLCDDK